MQRHRSHGPEVHSLEKVLPPAWHLGPRTDQFTVPPRLASLGVSRTSECGGFSGEGRLWDSSHVCAEQLSKSTESLSILPAADCRGSACRPMRAARSALRHPPPPLESRCPTPPRAPPHGAVQAAKAAIRVREPGGHFVRSARHRRLSPLPLVSLPLTARTPGSKLHSEQLQKGRRGHVGTTSSSTCASGSSLTPRTSSLSGVIAAHQINLCKPMVPGGAASSCHSELTEAELQAAEEAICAETAAEMVDSVIPMSEVGNHDDFVGSTCEEVKEEVHSKRPQEEQGVTIPMGFLLPEEEDDNSDSDMDMVAGVRAAGRVRQNANFAATIAFIVGQHFHAAAPNKEVTRKGETEAVARHHRDVPVGQSAQSGRLEEGQVTEGQVVQCPLADTCAATAITTRVAAESCGECSTDATSSCPKPNRPTACHRPLLAEVFQIWRTCRNRHQETDGSVRFSMASPVGRENARLSGNAHANMELHSRAVENEELATARGTELPAGQYAGLILSRAIDCGSLASTCLSPSSAACTSRPQSSCVTAGFRGDGSTREPTWTDVDRSNEGGWDKSQITPAGHQVESTKLIASGCVLWEVSHGEPLPFGVARPTSAASSGMKTPLLR